MRSFLFAALPQLPALAIPAARPASGLGFAPRGRTGHIGRIIDSMKEISASERPYFA